MYCEHCPTDCKYRKEVNITGADNMKKHCCSYMADTGIQRECEPGPNCNKYKKGANKFNHGLFLYKYLTKKG